MKCLDIERFLDAYLDGEFDERERVEFELHIAECDACRHTHDHQLALRDSIRDALHTPAPCALRDRIALALDDAPLASQPHWTRWRGWRTVSLAAAACALAGLTFVGLSTEPDHLSAGLGSTLTAAQHPEPQADEEEPLVHESVDWHRKRLPMEVTGPHADVVGTWFRDKVDFPVRLPRFQNPNIALLGGRLAHVQDRKAALLTLEVKQRKLSMMVVPSPPHTRDLKPRLTLRKANGYNIAIVHDNGITYALTSDLSQHDLNQIVRTSFPGL